jgi:cullin 1
MAAPIAAPAMPPSGADLATTWAFLEEGVDHIMTKLQTGVSYSKYMSLYTVAYNYCTSSRMHNAGEVGGGVGSGRSQSLSFAVHTPNNEARS